MDSINTKEYVVLIDNRAEQRLLRPADHKNFKWRKSAVKLHQLSSFEFFQTIEVGEELKLAEEQFGEEESSGEEDGMMGTSNNKEIYTLADPQKLQPEEIRQLKASKKGEDVIQTIVQNNEQFEKRTAYSKEKYINKKKRKYLFQFHAEPATLEAVHKFYFLNDPKSIHWIRWDIMALLFLYMGPLGHVLISEKGKGLLLGGLLQRQCSSVTVAAEETKNFKRFPIVEQLNIKKEAVAGKVRFADWKALASEAGSSQSKYNNLILVGNYDFAGIFEMLLPCLARNAALTFYSQTLEPFQPLIEAMKASQQIVHIKLMDSWAREYQVLQNRTHPMMYMPSHSGYLVTAIRVGF